MKECPSCHTDLNLKRHEFQRHQVLCRKYQLHIDKLDNGKFECQDCRREFQSMKSIFAHLSKVHFKEFFARQLDSKCNNCDQRYNKRSFKKHKKLCGLYSMHITHVAVDGKWACNFCGQLMNSQSSMFKHVGEKHANSKASKEINLVEFSDEEDVDGVYEDFGHLEDHGEGYVDDHVNIDDTFEIKNESDLPLTQPIKLKIQKTLFSTDEDDQGLEETPHDSPKSVENEDKSSNDEQQDNFPGSIFQVFQCEMCDTPFVNQEYVTDHLRTYHKYQKDCSTFIRIKKL